jgi:hypothetical protein
MADAAQLKVPPPIGEIFEELDRVGIPKDFFFTEEDRDRTTPAPRPVDDDSDDPNGRV